MGEREGGRVRGGRERARQSGGARGKERVREEGIGKIRGNSEVKRVE